jgi:hypothetical protein
MDHLPTSALIARGRQLTAMIADAESELKLIEAEIRHRALAMPHEPLADGNREGRRARLRDAGQEVTVLFESDVLKASFAADSPTGIAIETLLPPAQVNELFRRKTTLERIIKDGHKFRLHCSNLLPPDVATQVIEELKDRDKNGITKSKSVIEWQAS